MTNEEFSNRFDIQLGSYVLQTLFGYNQPLSFDEYEKSVFLTRAQEEIVLSLYNGKLSSFEENEETRRYLSNLIKTVVINKDLQTHTLTEGDADTDLDYIETETICEGKSKIYKLPDDLWFITFESVKLSDEYECIGGSSLTVRPITQDDFERLRRNPFRGMNERRALRLDLAGNKVEIVCNYNITSYKVRYIKKLSPIVLQDFDEDDLAIDGVSVSTECEVHPTLHDRILDVAVRLAIASRVPQRADSNSNNDN